MNALRDSDSKLPESVAEAVDCLLDELDPTFLNQLRETPKESLRVYHHEWGPIFQNRLGLLGRNQLLIEECKHLYGVRMRLRYSEFELERLSEIEPLMPRKSAFVVILESLWDRLQKNKEAKRRPTPRGR
jgi:hypothetical protein